MNFLIGLGIFILIIFILFLFASCKVAGKVDKESELQFKNWELERKSNNSNK